MSQDKRQRFQTFLLIAVLAALLSILGIVIWKTKSAKTNIYTASATPVFTQNPNHQASQSQESSPGQKQVENPFSTKESNNLTSHKTSKPIPANVLRTLKLIDAGLWPEAANAKGTKGGDIWHNWDNQLPVIDKQGNRIEYREWDVNPKKRYQPRDAQRIVTGSDGSAWYTLDHYRTFTRIR